MLSLFLLTCLINLSIADDQFYYTVADRRKCMSPMCGGYFVSALNQDKTQCRGEKSASCYVAAIEPNGFPGAVVLGHISPSSEYKSFDVLEAKSTWRNVLPDAPILDTTAVQFFRVSLNRQTCNGLSPCPPMIATLLNMPKRGRIFQMNIFQLDGPADLQALATDELDTRSIIVVGTIQTDEQVGGNVLTITQLFLEVLPERECHTDNDCTYSTLRAVVRRKSECFCRVCPQFYITQTEAARRQAAFDRYCQEMQQNECPMYKCMAPRPAACLNGMCAPGLSEEVP